MNDSRKDKVDRLIAETDSHVLRSAVMRCYVHFSLILFGIPMALMLILAVFVEPLTALVMLFMLPVIVVMQGFMFGIFIGIGQYFQKRKMGVL